MQNSESTVFSGKALNSWLVLHMAYWLAPVLCRGSHGSVLCGHCSSATRVNREEGELMTEELAEKAIYGCFMRVTQDERICSPPFMVLNSECGPDTLEQIKQHGLTFPFICKTRVAHGTNSHEMAIIFSAEDLKDVKPPCVIQSFINHNAVLYKVFVVGESYTVVERPSLKNFPSGPADRKAIFFNSHNVSKPESSSDLTSRDNVEGVSQPPNNDVIRELCTSLRQALSVSLFGIDVIINNQTGQHAVIDINAFPGYEGVPEFFTDLLNHITSVLQGQSSSDRPPPQLAAPPPAALPALVSDQCCSLLGEESHNNSSSSSSSSSSAWILEGEEGLKSPCQRLGCNSAVSPNFQKHCVATIATKASSQ
ncbi:inositol-tetrakisphosphate 1-kinase [Tachysurus ichikawai]